MAEEKPNINVMEGAPFIVKGLKTLTDGDGKAIPMEKEVIALCRCGASKSKPFCDGAHHDINFTGANEAATVAPVREYEGDELTVVDDSHVCCHAGACVQGAEDVFFKWEGDERVSTPNAATSQRVIDTIRKCPSGSLAYKLKGELQDQYFSNPEIQILKDGPIAVRGGITIKNPDGAAPATLSHYTLCRCGASKNKPYCDGAHNDIGFSDEG